MSPEQDTPPLPPCVIGDVLLTRAVQATHGNSCHAVCNTLKMQKKKKYREQIQFLHLELSLCIQGLASLLTGSLCETKTNSWQKERVKRFWYNDCMTAV